jgi:hypothetical protein
VRSSRRLRLILLIFGLARADGLQYGPVVVVSYIGAAYWFTLSRPSPTLQ